MKIAFVLLLLVFLMGCGSSTDGYDATGNGDVIEVQPPQIYANQIIHIYETSPNGNFHIEGIGPNETIGWPLEYEIRLIDISSSEIKWSTNGRIAQLFMWTDNNRFVAVQYQGRLWIGTLIVDTHNFSTITLPCIDDIIAIHPYVEEPFFQAPYAFTLVGWESPTVVIIDFEWRTNYDSIAGRYTYDVLSSVFNIIQIQ